MGCSECGLILRLKQVSCTEEIIGVDVNATILGACSRMVQPLTIDYVMPRERPLRIQLLHGTVYSDTSVEGRQQMVYKLPCFACFASPCMHTL